MPFSPRKAEVEEVVDAITQHREAEDVAKAALKASFAVIQRRELWAVATDARMVYGPYASETDAYNALAAGKVTDFVDEEGIKQVRKEKGVPTLGGKAAVLKTIGPLALAESAEEKDEKARRTAERLCATCDHPLLAHGITNRSSKCSTSGCSCPEPKKP